MLRVLRSVLPLALIFAIGSGCDSSNPTAPGSPLQLFLSGPSAVEIGQAAPVTVRGTRGTDAAADLGVMLTTDFGTLSAVNVTLDEAGMAQVTFTAPDTEGLANLAAVSGSATAGIGITVEATEGVFVDTNSLELDFSRSSSKCPEPIKPIIEVLNYGSDPVNFEVVDNLKAWLTVDFFTGPVPGTLQAIFTCKVGDGDLDLRHSLRIQGKDPTTDENVGIEAVVDIVVRVRD